MADDDRSASAPEVNPGDVPPSTLESTFTLLDRARKGDDRAFEELFRRHLGPLQRWARGRLPNWARDLSTRTTLPDTLLRTFKHLDCFDPRGVGRFRRTFASDRQSGPDVSVERDGDQIWRVLMARADRGCIITLRGGDWPRDARTLRGALQRLRPEERDGRLWRARDGLQLRGIGEVLGKPTADPPQGCATGARPPGEEMRTLHDDKAYEDRAGAILDGLDVTDGGESRCRRRRSLVPIFACRTHRQSVPQECRGRVHGDRARRRCGRAPELESAPTEWGHLRIRNASARAFVRSTVLDSKLDRDVALKLLPEHRSLPDGGAAILEEGRLLARVHHRNVVSIYGADRIDNRVGLWMELIDGETLQQAMERGRAFSPADAVRIGLELAGASRRGSHAGLLHRDVNRTTSCWHGTTRRLMDFGTGYDARTGERRGLSGTPLYLAPELLAGRPPSVSTDIYSVGVVLFYLLTRTHPVRGETLSDLYVAHQGGPAPDVRHLRSDVPRALALAIARALDPEPGRRQPDAKFIGFGAQAIYGGLLTLAMVAAWRSAGRALRQRGAASGSSERESRPAEGTPCSPVLTVENLDAEPGGENSPKA